MLDRDLLEKKLEILSGYIDELKPFVDIFSVDEILKDNYKYHTAERLFQLVVDAMVGINIHIIKEGNLGAPDDLQSTFSLLGTFNVLKVDFADKIAPMVGLRNMIVHKYEKLSRQQFIDTIRKDYDDFKRYVVDIGVFIKTKNVQ